MVLLLQFLPAFLGIVLSWVLYNQVVVVKINRVLGILSLLVSISACIGFFATPKDEFSQIWIFQEDVLSFIGASFDISFSGVSLLLSLLTSLAFCVVYFLPIPETVHMRITTYFSLFQLCQFALYGVFTSNDAFFFYLFWELTLIPIYFLSSFFGGANAVRITFSFFIYTFLASILLLVAFIYIYSLSDAASFDYEAITHSNLKDSPYALLIFWLMFIAFAVKTPIAPFHTWQASLYQTAPTTLSLVLGSVVAKMGLFGVFRWLLPMFNFDMAWFAGMSTFVVFLSAAGVLFGALIAMRQKNIKALLAYSSLSHLSLMMAGLFSNAEMAMQGALFQMFVHGLVNIGLWAVVVYVEQQHKTAKIDAISGLIYQHPILSYCLVLLALANIGLPLTGNFVGEWMMFAGILQSVMLDFTSALFVVIISGFSVIIGAVYTLSFIQKVVYGSPMQGVHINLNSHQVISIVAFVFLVLALGVYPNGCLKMVEVEVICIIENMQSLLY